MKKLKEEKNIMKKHILLIIFWHNLFQIREHTSATFDDMGMLINRQLNSKCNTKYRKHMIY